MQEEKHIFYLGLYVKIISGPTRKRFGWAIAVVASAKFVVPSSSISNDLIVVALNLRF